MVSLKEKCEDTTVVIKYPMSTHLGCLIQTKSEKLWKVPYQSNMAVIAGIYEQKQIIVPLETRNLNPNVFFLVEYNIHVYMYSQIQ
jgi:hypothetical protein